MKNKDMRKAVKEIMAKDDEYSTSPMSKAEALERKTAELSAEETGEDMPMDEVELQSIVATEITDAISYIDSDLSPYRAQATAYYRGDLFGNEEEGQSQVVATEVRDTVNSMLPSIMRVFFSS